MAHHLGSNQYGKAENRVVRIYRDTDRHEIRDLNVSTALRGDFTAAHTTGDQAGVLPTDTQKNTAFAWARKHGVSSVEDYALALGARLLEASPAATSSRVEVDEYAWDRITVDGRPHDHAFVRRGDGTRTTIVTQERDGQTHVVSGVKDLVVLKSTGSEFKGFLKDEFTTLPEADDRILATSLVARWRYDGTDVEWNTTFDEIRATLLATFATTYSRALQESLYAMGSAVLDHRPEVAEIRFSAPNKHHFLYDLDRFGIDNPGEVFHAADRPYGLIEACVERDGASDPGTAWLATPGFC
ncbi:factor-independent urate hydroxylase [Luteipulveratus halotolerans]|uniref:Uricase n=1 Tax=Luteipulveratus halotolerans TaxID=1631356 RepID=A0A0L6CED5_9MICO|nr:urate oxidase [Luteipulveratus halotolerans]KNX36034.1 urate oxidase [Luteipulveratus halotolerans]